MLQKSQKTAAAETELLGDLTPLLAQIGSPDGRVALGDVWRLPDGQQINSLPAFRSFLTEYQTRVLRPLELPAIQRAFTHSQRNELRELIAFDQSLASENALKHFAAASRAVGLARLQRLRPLHDQRMVKRYLAAVEGGSANGWHTTVYGLLLAVYSLPLRPGLVSYAQGATRGFIQSAACSCEFSRVEVETLVSEFSARLPAAVEALPGMALKSPAAP
jgi:urease accessory protein UreF